jgi:hypothetical protein
MIMITSSRGAAALCPLGAPPAPLDRRDCATHAAHTLLEGRTMPRVALLLVPLFLLACDREERPAIEGAWELVSSTWQSGDSVVFSFPDKVKGSDMKFFVDGHFAFVGKFEMDTTIMNSFGGGTFTLDGENYVEHIRYHDYPAAVGKTMYFTLAIKGDTLIQKGPVKQEPEAVYAETFTEVYVRRQ